MSTSISGGHEGPIPDPSQVKLPFPQHGDEVEDVVSLMDDFPHRWHKVRGGGGHHSPPAEESWTYLPYAINVFLYAGGSARLGTRDGLAFLVKGEEASSIRQAVRRMSRVQEDLQNVQGREALAKAIAEARRLH